MSARRLSKKIYIGNVDVGGDAPVRVQSMTKTLTSDVEATVREIAGLEDAGCEIIRCAVPDMAAAQAIPEIKRRIHIPLVADIHFHHHLAIESLKGGVDGLRLNPGNIRDPEKVREVVKLAKERQVPIRVGVNFGSLPPVGLIGQKTGTSRLTDGVNKLAKAGGPAGAPTVVDHMVQTALWEIGLLEEQDFDLIKISMKAFDVPTTVEAYRRIAALVPYPLHLGITESGTVKSGTVRSAVGLGLLL
ncbi:MAG: flavodoxin-dependent (E)-4-hydroxy-3-methylbut-2-enyl-diphosphate synthase, partial [Chloroflexota bacterium]